jgi:hypothetical protein
MWTGAPGRTPTGSTSASTLEKGAGEGLRADPPEAREGASRTYCSRTLSSRLPAELDGVAGEIHVHFPWGSPLGYESRVD